MINKYIKSTKLTIFAMLVCVISVAFCSNLSAQEVMRADDWKKTASQSQIDEFNTLTQDIHPIIYADREGLRPYGEGQKVSVFCKPDNGSIARLYQPNSDFAGVKIIRVNIENPEDLNALFDLSKLTSFAALEKIFFVYTYNTCDNYADNCLSAITAKLITGVNDKITVLYQLSIAN